MKENVEQVFVTEGVPHYTFVEPPNFSDILMDVRRPGKPVVIEGQSGTGKTTCVKKVIAQLGTTATVHYLSARIPLHLEQIHHIPENVTQDTFVIDDFHRLDAETRSRLADIAKVAAEQGEDGAPLPKLVLIGINELGTDLIQMVPDIAKRMGIHRILPASKQGIENLVDKGCSELNISFSPESIERIYSESRGDYWLAQHLCQTICAMNNIINAPDAVKELTFDLDPLRVKVVERLRAAYYPAVKEFCRGQRFRPENDPYFRLLRAIASQDSSVVDLNTLANSMPDVKASINAIKERRLADLLGKKDICAKHFYYNVETKGFALEDAALFYFLRHLNWPKLRTDCGFKEEAKACEFDYAISFAGENRAFARAIVDALLVLDVSVFFDENYESNYLGKTWTKEFRRIFLSDSRRVICVLDKHHQQKIWPTFEREILSTRVADGEVIPIFLDDTVFVGIPQDVVGIKLYPRPDDGPEVWKKRGEDAALKILEAAP